MMAKTLEQHQFDDDDSEIDDATLEALLNMPKTNGHLEFLSLTLFIEQFEQFESEFAAYNGQLLGYPMALSTKLAFLSVAKHAHASEDQGNVLLPSVLGQLDSHVLSFVFQLAGEAHVRAIRLNRCHT
ncbi:hypothetical protein Poli38472_013730 [Pythium oligandrum]|uniref:Uncharacterized protein n=1 Tax=Pythium oligandrum TaxID=41045 RepID=A0A8K1CDH6_PYTOL|nr:hypothetical protein Poli38472_013730 [Pythium oligandrum]|eukprot:TMW61267.1 hypothetical protein Poli38472_013730 [Pythium oligandrum]